METRVGNGDSMGRENALASQAVGGSRSVATSDNLLDDGVDLRELLRLIRQGRWLIIIITSAFVALGAAYAFLATEWYRADVLLASASPASGPLLGEQISGLASLAGISVGGPNAVEPLAVLKSRSLSQEFIEEFNLIPILFADSWDGTAKEWKGKYAQRPPDIRDAVRYFNKNVRVVSEDKRTGLVTLGMQWKDPDVAAVWAEAYVEKLNSKMRRQAQDEAENNIKYLKQELAASSQVDLQQSIGRLLEGEMKKAMLARGSREFSFRILDQAVPPKHPERPRRLLTMVLATAVGALMSVVILLLRSRATVTRRIEQATPARL